MQLIHEKRHRLICRGVSDSNSKTVKQTKEYHVVAFRIKENASNK